VKIKLALVAAFAVHSAIRNPHSAFRIPHFAFRTWDIP